MNACPTVCRETSRWNERHQVRKREPGFGSSATALASAVGTQLGGVGNSDRKRDSIRSSISSLPGQRRCEIKPAGRLLRVRRARNGFPLRRRLIGEIKWSRLEVSVFCCLRGKSVWGGRARWVVYFSNGFSDYRPSRNSERIFRRDNASVFQPGRFNTL